jgi:hypothetical protein
MAEEKIIPFNWSLVGQKYQNSAREWHTVGLACDANGNDYIYVPAPAKAPVTSETRSYEHYRREVEDYHSNGGLKRREVEERVKAYKEVSRSAYTAPAPAPAPAQPAQRSLPAPTPLAPRNNSPPRREPTTVRVRFPAYPDGWNPGPKQVPAPMYPLSGPHRMLTPSIGYITADTRVLPGTIDLFAAAAYPPTYMPGVSQAALGAGPFFVADM